MNHETGAVLHLDQLDFDLDCHFECRNPATQKEVSGAPACAGVTIKGKVSA